VNWSLEHGVWVSDDTDLGYYVIHKHGPQFRAWLHREDKDSVIVCCLPDLETVQNCVRAYDREAKPNTVHRTARRYLS